VVVTPEEAVALFRCVVHILGIRDDVSEIQQNSIASDLIANAKCLTHFRDGDSSSNGSSSNGSSNGSRRGGEAEPSVFMQLASIVPETSAMLPVVKAAASEDSSSGSSGVTTTTPTPKKGKARREWLVNKVAAMQHRK
jgi:hypothetical protein